jgi:hypothetical protein
VFSNGNSFLVTANGLVQAAGYDPTEPALVRWLSALPRR